MQVLRLFAALFAALVIHLVIVSATPELARVLDVFLLVVVFQAMSARPLRATLAGTLVGLTQDAVSGGLYGLHGVACTCVGYLMARVAQSLSLQKSYYVALFFASASLLEQLVLQALLAGLLQRPSLPSPLELTFSVLVTGALGALVVAVIGRASDRYHAWRHERRPGITLE